MATPHASGARVTICVAAALAVMTALASPSEAQDTTVDSRAATIEQAQAQKAIALHPFQPNKVEAFLDDVENTLLNGGVSLHPFFDNAYAGGGFTLGAGYARRVSSYNIIDFRGSVTFTGYTRLETAFMAPRLFDRRALADAHRRLARTPLRSASTASATRTRRRTIAPTTVSSSRTAPPR